MELFKKIGRFFEGLLDIGLVNNNSASDVTMNNKKLLSELVAVFNDTLQKESVGGRMLYPMYFNILMHPLDYEDRKDSLVFILPAIVTEFYSIINQEKHQYPDYRPTAKCWVFQFSPCSVTGKLKIGNDTISIERGKLKPFARLYSADMGNLSGGVSVDNNVKVSFRCDNSDVTNYTNINLAALTKVNVLDEGLYAYKFDMDLPTDARVVESESKTSEMNGLAKLSYSYRGKIYSYVMRDNQIVISGKSDMRSERFVFKVESDDVMTGHIQIRCTPSDNQFQIAAFGEVRLNSRGLEKSSGGKMNWYVLANKSQIFINQDITVLFEKLI